MSYYFNMCFWSASSLSTAMKKAKEVVDAMSTPEIMQHKISENMYYVPSMRYLVNPETWNMGMQADTMWLYKLFNYQFVYWKEHKLLGMAGEIPDNGPKPTGAVAFQNSCDQDYSLSDWPARIPFFKERINKYQAYLKLSPKKAFEVIRKEGFIEECCIEEIIKNDECNAENAKYYILTSLYSDIYSTLHLNEWLWGKEHDSFQRFSLCGIKTTEQQYDLERYLRKEVIARLGNLGNKKTFYIPVSIPNKDNASAHTLMFKYDIDRYEDNLLCEEKVKKLIRLAVEKYLSTEDGRRFIYANGGCQHWSEVVAFTPRQYFREQGLDIVKRDTYCDTVSISKYD